MTSNAGCWKPRLAVLAIATSLLCGCATVGSDQRITAVCPPVVEYMGLYSLINLWAKDLLRPSATPYAAAWYRNSAFTFTDVIAAVRRRSWMGDISDSSAHDRDMRKIPPDRLIRMAEALCFAA